jgi:NADH dehydrogenase
MLVPGTSNVWALGDCAAVPNAWDGRDSPPTAQFATRQARWLARNLVRTIQGRPTEPFRYRPMGMLASIGHHNAVAEILGVHISGFLAWFLWRGIYLSKLPTLGRKIEVAIDWAWQIFFPPNIVQLQMSRSQRIGRAHFAAGEFVYRRGDPGDRFFVIERGQAAVYLDEKAAPASRLNAGDHFGEGALLSTDGRGLHAFSVKAETSLDLITIGRDDFAGLSRFLLEHTLSNA